MSIPLIINFAPTGLIPTRMTPHVPLQPAAIVTEVCEAAELGITTVHLHARGPDDSPTQDLDVVREIIGGIRAVQPDLVICVSTSGRRVRTGSSRSAPLSLTRNLKPDMASLTLVSLNFAGESSENAPATIMELSQQMTRAGIMPELEVFDLGMINYAHYLIGKGVLHPPYYFNILLGNVASAQCDLMQAGLLVRELPADSQWSFAGIGRDQLRASAFAIATGGGVRIGLEDNIYHDQSRRTLATNAGLLRRIHTLADMFERPVMQPSEFRERMQLGSGPTGYGRKPATGESQMSK